MKKKTIWKVFACLTIAVIALSGYILYRRKFRDEWKDMEDNLDNFEKEETKEEEPKNETIKPRSYHSIPLSSQEETA